MNARKKADSLAVQEKIKFERHFGNRKIDCQLRDILGTETIKYNSEICHLGKCLDNAI